MIPCSRILGLRYVPARTLKLRGYGPAIKPRKYLETEYLLRKVGWIAPIIVREKADGLHVLDGDMRVKLAGDQLVPCIVVALSDNEARAFEAAGRKGWRPNLKKLLEPDYGKRPNRQFGRRRRDG